MYWEKYHLSRTLDEALTVLAYYGGEARVVAGGTDLMLGLKERRHRVKALVDISRLTELRQIREVGGWLKVGALNTHTDLAGSALVQAKAAALAEASACVGSAQIRNVGTLGGNVVNAQPAADTSVALLALDARAVVVSRKGETIRPLADLFLGPGRSAVDPATEIVTEFLIPLSAGRTASSFQRLSRRKALVLPILNAAAGVELTADGKHFRLVRLAAGPVAPIPWRAGDAEALLAGAPVSGKLVKEASLITAREAKPRDSLRGSAAYRREMVKVLVYRAIVTAVERLGGAVDG